MRSIERIFLILLIAFVFALTPFVAMAADTTAESTEVNHSKYGMDTWIDSYDDNLLLFGVQVEGDGAYGYYSGLNPGFQGAGTGIINTTADGSLGAPSYTTPCPEFDMTDTTRADGTADCAANADSRLPQTNPTGVGYDNVWEIPIVDDLLAKMWDYTAANDRLTQALDILFVIDPKTEKEGIIDQTLDQDLADYTGDAESSFMTAGVGIVNRVTQRFGMENILAKTASMNPGGNLGQISANGSNDADYIDQWVLSYTKDVVVPVTGSVNQVVGIVSSYSSWFSLDKNTEPNCDSCTYTYDTEHDPVVKNVPQIDNHPKDDLPTSPGAP